MNKQSGFENRLFYFTKACAKLRAVFCAAVVLIATQNPVYAQTPTPTVDPVVAAVISTFSGCSILSNTSANSLPVCVSCKPGFILKDSLCVPSQGTGVLPPSVTVVCPPGFISKNSQCVPVERPICPPGFFVGPDGKCIPLTVPCQPGEPRCSAVTQLSPSQLTTPQK